MEKQTNTQAHKVYRMECTNMEKFSHHNNVTVKLIVTEWNENQWAKTNIKHDKNNNGILERNQSIK